MRYADFTPNLRPGLRREATTEFTNQTQQLNSKAQLAISRIALDQQVEGSNLVDLVGTGQRNRAA